MYTTKSGDYGFGGGERQPFVSHGAGKKGIRLTEKLHCPLFCQILGNPFVCVRGEHPDREIMTCFM